MFSQIWSVVVAMSWMELSSTCLFVVLALITVYRKKLSTNHEYRSNCTTPTSSRRPSKSLSIEEELSLQTLLLKTKLSNFTSTFIADTETSLSNKANTCLNELNNDLLYLVSTFLDTESILHLGLVNKRLHHSTTQDAFWRLLWVDTIQPIWCHPVAKALMMGRKEVSCYPQSLRVSGGVSWKQFYLICEVVWMDYLCAGYTARDRCVLGLDGIVYDVSQFLYDHPGSAETLAEHCGQDATQLYREIGHSTRADILRLDFCVLNPDVDVSCVRGMHGVSQRLSRLLRSRCAELAAHPRQTLVRQLLAHVQAQEAVDLVTPPFVRPIPRCPLVSGVSYWDSCLSSVGHQNAHVGADHQQPQLPVNGGIPGIRVISIDSDSTEERHSGGAKVCFDPVQWRFVKWYCCCGHYLFLPTESFHDALDPLDTLLQMQSSAHAITGNVQHKGS